MDVRCEHCNTEYEFDDALVSARGTTVKCMRCGHQFKVHRPATIPPAADRWSVTRPSGQEVVFTHLRDLQRAIAAGQVEREALLRRFDGPPRALGAIPELESFFEPRTSPTFPPRPLTVTSTEQKIAELAGMTPPPQALSSLAQQEGLQRITSIPPPPPTTTSPGPWPQERPSQSRLGAPPPIPQQQASLAPVLSQPRDGNLAAFAASGGSAPPPP